MPIALFRRNDFREIVILAADHKGIPNPEIVEKDYFVTEALRVISQKHGHHTIFKGGTSLSKGWGLIDRFSEDVDLYVQPGATKNATGKLLKQIAEDVSKHEAFDEPERDASIDNIARSTFHSYTSKFPSVGPIKPRVLLEIGIQSGTDPTVERPIQSILAEVLVERGVKDLGEDCESFPMQLLHYKRTAMEKMFALHHKVQARGGEIGTYARHYYDLYQLLQQYDVQVMLRNREFIQICQDYRTLTNEYFSNQVLPEHMNLSQSSALYPSTELAKTLSDAYEAQCRALCYGTFPGFAEVLNKLDAIRGYFVDVP